MHDIWPTINCERGHGDACVPLRHLILAVKSGSSPLKRVNGPSCLQAFHAGRAYYRPCASPIRKMLLHSLSNLALVTICFTLLHIPAFAGRKFSERHRDHLSRRRNAAKAQYRPTLDERQTDDYRFLNGDTQSTRVMFRPSRDGRLRCHKNIRSQLSLMSATTWGRCILATSQ